MSHNLIDFTGRIVVVSGAAGGGIGTTLTRMLAEQGACVIAVSRSQANLDQHFAPMVAEGLAVISVSADAETEEGIAATMAAAARAPGTLWGLVNVAGGATPETWGRATRAKRSDWRALMAQNLETMVFMSQAVAAELRKQGLPGSIVSLSSLSGANSAAFHLAYGTAKAGVIAATRTLALELALDNIRVNCVSPGITVTPASLVYIDEDAGRDRRAIAMGRRGRPDEQAGAVLFLLSDLASYVTGQTLLVDGGLSLKWSHYADDNTTLFMKDGPFRESIKQ